MSTFLYNIGVRGLGVAVKLASPFNIRADKWIRGQKKWRTELGYGIEKLDRKKPVVWFHASSLGEFEQGLPVMEALKKGNHINLVLTFYSPSGFEMMKNWKTADAITYLPIDSKKNAIEFINIVKPDLAVFIKYEFWYHYLNQLKKRKIKTVVISARFYPKQVFFKRWAGWYRDILFLIDKIFVQNKASEKLLNAIGYKNSEVSGDTRFDRVLELSRNTDKFKIIEKFTDDKPVFIAGSSWPLDENLICEYINQYPDKFKYIIAPHDIGESHLKKIEKLLNVPTERYTNYTGVEPVDVLLLDTIGMLSRIYKYADIAYVGGAFKEGLHNILEPAAYGCPVISGPDIAGFPEAADMEKAKALVRVKDYNELETIINQWADNQKERDVVSADALTFIQSHAGATQKVVDELKSFLEKSDVVIEG